MPYTNPLKIETINTGEKAGTWGAITNTNLSIALAEAITGRATATFTSDSTLTLDYENVNTTQPFRNLVLNIDSTTPLSATRDVIIPSIQKQYFVENKTLGGQSIRVKTSSGIGVTIPNQRTANIFCDGTDTRLADDYVDINGGSIDGTPIGASSASTGVFSTVTAVTGNIDTVNATTINVTTANISGGNLDLTTADIDTLNVGTQASKATISYTTNAARTLTIPAVSGNRTFAFLEEAQTFTANQTIGANLTFTGNARRFIAPFESQDPNGFLFQHSSVKGTSIGVIPNGGVNDTSLFLYSNADPSNSSWLALYSSPTITFIDVNSLGTATTQDLHVVVDGLSVIQIDSTTRHIGINQAPEPLVYDFAVTGDIKFDSGTIIFPQQYGQTVSGSPRTLFINLNGALGGLSSTRESKTNIELLDDVSWLMDLEPVSYNRRKQDDNKIYTDEFYDETEFGLIADDAEKVAPDICVYVEEGGEKKLSGIEYFRLIAPMLKEIQNLRAEIEALKAKGV